VSGELDVAEGGPSVDATVPRRTVYTKLIRYSPEPLLQAFDAPDGFVSIPQRDTTTTATQALSLLNGSWALGRAGAVPARLVGPSQGPTRPTALVERAYRLVLGRAPDRLEMRSALRFLSAQPARVDAANRAVGGREAGEQALVDFCHVLLNS